MTLSAQQRKRIAWLLDGYLADDDEATFPARWERSFTALSTPEELFLFASHSHSSQEPAEWRRLLAHPLCDQGTALLIFWRNSPVHYYGDEPASGWERDRERFDLVHAIAEKCAVSGYPSTVVRFDPAAFKGFRFLARHSAAELDRVPAHMRCPDPGESVPPLVREDFDWSDGF